MEMPNLSEMRERFNSSLRLEAAKPNSFLLTQKKYCEILNRVIHIKTTNRKECPGDYHLLKRYDTTFINGCERLIKPLTATSRAIKPYVITDELFDILYSIHIEIGHGGRNRMVSALNSRYANINRIQISKFLSVCDLCLKKKEKVAEVSKPIVSSQIYSRCQVELIDYESQPDGDFKFLLVYKDYSSKFVVLKPLTSIKTDEVSENILDIFLLLGAPVIFHSDIGEEFCTSIIQNLKSKSPELKMVSGKCGYDQDSQILIEEIRSMLTVWMEDNKTNKWSSGARFVQFMKNKNYHNGLKLSPYEAMFGCPVKFGLASFSFPDNLINEVASEDDLNNLCHPDKHNTELLPYTVEPFYNEPECVTQPPCVTITEEPISDAAKNYFWGMHDENEIKEKN